VKRRDDPTSAKVSTILGSYDKAKDLVTSAQMIGAILQPATPRPSKSTAGPGLLTTPPSVMVSRPGASDRKQPTDAARSGVKAELSRQGVFEQFQQQASAVVSHVENAVYHGCIGSGSWFLWIWLEYGSIWIQHLCI